MSDLDAFLTQNISPVLSGRSLRERYNAGANPAAGLDKQDYDNRDYNMALVGVPLIYILPIFRMVTTPSLSTFTSQRVG